MVPPTGTQFTPSFLKPFLQLPHIVVPVVHVSLLALAHAALAAALHTSSMQQAVEASPKSTEASHSLPAHVPELSLIAGDAHVKPAAAELHACLATQESPTATKPSLHGPHVTVPVVHVSLLALVHAASSHTLDDAGTKLPGALLMTSPVYTGRPDG